MTRRTPPTPESAPETYKARGVEIETQMEALAEALDAHQSKHEATPHDWGYVGDLERVRTLLAQALVAVGGRGR